VAEANWTQLGNSLAAGDVSRGVTAGVTPPYGGGTYIFGFNSRTSVAGAVGYSANQANFGPLRNDLANPTGGSIRGAIQRGVSAGPLSFAPMLFIGLQNAVPYGTVNDQGYLLGLSEDDPHEIILRKGAPAGGLLPTASGVLRRSTAQYLPGVWLHLRLDMIVNPNGDTVLKVFQSDLDTNLVTAPVWAAIAGMDDIIDDALGINTESLPFSGGFAGFAFQTQDVSRRGFVDQIQLLRQK